MYTLGIDLGSSFIKFNVLEIETNSVKVAVQFPKQEMKIEALQSGWAEQDPATWINHCLDALKEIGTKIDINLIKAIGITYQMHGLVLVDKNGKLLRSAIIWCDSRAVSIGEKALSDLGVSYCASTLLNSPGNFTASKLKWVKENEPEIYKQIHKVMLPGDYIAYQLTGKLQTTVSGLSEAILWDFKNDELAKDVLKYYEIDSALIPDVIPSFGVNSFVSQDASKKFNVPEGIPVSYRAGDQPNNAFSLGVLNAGEVAATAGTSGVVYGVLDAPKIDKDFRINTFVHVNHTKNEPKLGSLLCINAIGIANAWVKRNLSPSLTYEDMNVEMQSVPIGSDELLFYPFGNGAERMLVNKNNGATFKGIDLNRHTRAHLLRAVHEGIAFSFVYGMKIMSSEPLKTIRAANGNMFLSKVFKDTIAGATGSKIELYNTDGAEGAARGAAFGADIYTSINETFSKLEKVDEVCINEDVEAYHKSYAHWLSHFDDIKK